MGDESSKSKGRGGMAGAAAAQLESYAKSSGKGRVRWSRIEEDYLIEGVRKLGKSWAAILIEGKGVLNDCRTNVNLKDKFRNLRRAGKVPVCFSVISPLLFLLCAGKYTSFLVNIVCTQ